MQKTADTLVFSPSDLNHFLQCEHLIHLERARNHAFQQDRPQADLLAEKGLEHERRCLEAFRSEGRSVVCIEAVGGDRDWDADANRTLVAMESGIDVIYQGVFIDGDWRGVADFLIRVEKPSKFGGWSYEASDAKLARQTKPHFLLQLCFYTEQLERLQGIQPELMHVALRAGESQSYRYVEFAAYFRAVRRRFELAARENRATYPYPVAHCSFCNHAPTCEQTWEADEHLSLVAGIRRDQVERLNEGGITTVAELGHADDGSRFGIGATALSRLIHQAELQAHFRATGTHRYDLLPVSEENGFRLLPAPSAGDVFFDMEGDPFFDPSGGLEYLFGCATGDRGVPVFSAFRAANREEEKLAFEHFIDFVWDRLRRWPDLHVYHYASYETTALERLKRLMGTQATRAEELDELLRRDVFVDLYQIVRRSLRISHDSYSIKRIRTFFMPDAGKGIVNEGGQSVVEFERFLRTGDQRILDAIERYNEEDCISTFKLRDWLLERKGEAEQQFAVEIPWRNVPERRNKPLDTEPDAHAERRQQLFALGSGWTACLGRLLDYHRREAKPEWWAYFDRGKKSLDELLEDTEAIAYLRPTGEQVQVKKSYVHTLEFPPQEFKLKVDAQVEGPLESGSAGTIEWLDAANGRLGLRRGMQATKPLPHAIVAAGPVPDRAQREAIVRVADSIISESDRYSAVRAILGRELPRFRDLTASTLQTLDVEEQSRLAATLDGSYLFVQGPPGTGKTWTGARIAVSLIQKGMRVGVTAPSHKAIHNLLDEIERVAADAGVAFTGLKKRGDSEETAFTGRFITNVKKNEDCEESDALLIAGTAWLFARDRMEQKLDYLFIDEAGQFALADAVAVGTSARNIILLGDPQQLPHVTQNVHPEQSGVSVLEHLLGGCDTVSHDRGIFLAQSWRMHPTISRFLSELSYEGRLDSAPGCERQRVSSDLLFDSGLRYVPVAHAGNSQQSTEEAEVIGTHVRALLSGGTRTDRDGITYTITPGDILVVAPYNMQVRCIQERVPAGVEVGTVDKFQGREAPVVFFSTAASTAEDVPRGLEFLFSRNRFNVAISRAKCLAVVVGSPRLLDARCRAVDQMRLVNGFCRFQEQAVESRDRVEYQPHQPGVV